MMSTSPRRAFFIPLVLLSVILLGGALWVFSRRPRPQTEGDRWLWEQADAASRLDIMLPNDPAKDYPKRIYSIRMQCLEVKDRAGKRALLRAFRQTDFLPTKLGRPDSENRIADIIFIPPGGVPGRVGKVVQLYQERGRVYLWRDDGTQCPLDAASAQRFKNVLSAAIARAMHKQPGYALHTWRIET